MVDGVQNRGVASGWDAMPRWGVLKFGFKTDAPIGTFRLLKKVSLDVIQWKDGFLPSGLVINPG